MQNLDETSMVRTSIIHELSNESRQNLIDFETDKVKDQREQMSLQITSLNAQIEVPERVIPVIQTVSGNEIP